MKTQFPTVGRPSSDVKIPNQEFTFLDFCATNKNLAPLTLRNFMKKDRSLGKHSQIIRLEDERGEPGSQTGFGRKPYLYVRRELADKNGGGTTVRNIKYQVHKSHAPKHTIKRTELASPATPHAHQVVDIPMDISKTATSVTVSFAPVPNGAPVPTSVTVNFMAKPVQAVEIPQAAPQVAIPAPSAPEAVVVPPPAAVTAPAQESTVVATSQPVETNSGAAVANPQTEEPKAKKVNGGKKSNKSHSSKETPAAESQVVPSEPPPIAQAA